MNDQFYVNNYLKLKLSYHKYGELVSIVSPYVYVDISDYNLCFRFAETSSEWWGLK